MKIPAIPLAQSLILLFKHHQVKHIVISPGSRNAPLTLGFTQDDFFTCYSVVDERCAAFFATGMAQQLQQPVALVCTSGSAVLNYYPAVAEAFYSQIPLLIVSCDRPRKKIDIGDGQTIRQRNVLKKHTVFNANLSEEASAKNDKIIQKAIIKAQQKKAPVHINVPFEEPLYNQLSTYSYTPKLYDFKKKNKPAKVTTKDLEVWKKSVKKLVIVGTLPPHTLTDKVLQNLAEDPSVLVLTEVLGNVKHTGFIAQIDTLITSFSEQDVLDFQPDLLITIGGLIVSKRIKSLLRKYKKSEVTHWHIDELRAYDTYGLLSKHFKMLANDFFEKVYENSQKIESSYAAHFKQKMQQKLKNMPNFFDTIPFTDLKVFQILANKIPAHTQVQISNSSAIRYAMLVSFHEHIDVFCNRGTSGIDGSTSTAIGAASVSKKPTTLITGDISFFYDSNALWNNYIPKNFKIILLNNGGGGIFRILPGYENRDVFNQFFETQHHLSAEHLAKMYGFSYQTAKDEESLKKALDNIYVDDTTPQILEIFTPTELNSQILKDYFKVASV